MEFSWLSRASISKVSTEPEVALLALYAASAL
jgi:hypothetical protein